MAYLKNIFDVVIYKKLGKKTKRIKWLRRFMIGVLLLYFTYSVLFIAFNLEHFYSFKSTESELESKTGVGYPECSNLSFQDTAICIHDYAMELPFIYNVTDDKIDLTLEDLKRRGGDCRDWTNFYLKYMEYYGYDLDNQIVRGLVEKNENYSLYHVSLMSFDSTGYCHFDMGDLECYQYINEYGELRT